MANPWEVDWNDPKAVAKAAPSVPAKSADDAAKKPWEHDWSEKPAMSTGEAAKVGFLSGASANLRPFISGVAGAAGAAKGTYDVARDQGKSFPESLEAAKNAAGPAYSDARAQANQEESQAAQAHPGAFYGANLGGGLITAPFLPAGTLGKAAASGAGLGAAKALSSANDAGDVLKDVGEGAAGGALLHGAFQAVGKGASKLGSYVRKLPDAADDVKNFAASIIDHVTGTKAAPNLPSEVGPAEAAASHAGSAPSSELQSFSAADEGSINQPKTGKVINEEQDNPNFLHKIARERAFKSVGPAIKDLKYMPKENIQKMGKTLLDNNVIQAVPTGYEGLADRANAALEDKGLELQNHVDTISDAADHLAQKIGGDGSKFSISPQGLADDVRSNIKTNNKIPTLKNKASAFQELDNQVRELPLMSIKEAQAFKSELGRDLDSRGVWSRQKRSDDLSPEDQFNVQLYHSLNKSIEQTADAASDQLGPDMAKQWRQARQEYGALKMAAAMADLKAKRTFANRFISPSDYGAAGLAMIHGGGGVAALAASAAHNMGRKYGSQVMSYGANKLGNALQSVQGAPIDAGIGAVLPSAGLLATQGLLSGPQRQDQQSGQ